MECETALLKEELRQVTGPADQCVGQYHEVVRDIAICMIRDEMFEGHDSPHKEGADECASHNLGE